MKMMIWKELRENFKWAMLGLIGLFLAEIYMLSSEQKNFQLSYDGFTLCNPGFLMATSYGCALIGAAIGAAQILPERRRDQWAALLHRPVSRSVIFFGKVIAGLLLYFIATIVPFLASVWYVAAPGHFPAPFVPGMMVPGLSDLLLGMFFYFAAYLLCLHRGRWFGSQGMILLSLLPIFILHTEGHPFLVLPASLIFLLAAWGAMLGNGPWRTRPWAGQATYLLIVLVGVLVGIEFLLVIGKKIEGLTSHPQQLEYSQFEVSKSGRIFQITHYSDSEEVVTDMAGQVITDEAVVGNQSRQNFLRFTPLAYNLESEASWEEFYWDRISRNSQDYVQMLGYGYRNPENWYLLRAQNYLAGYDKLSRRCVGFFDQDGFKLPEASPKPFTRRLRCASYSSGNPILYSSGARIYAFDLAERRMTLFFDAQSDYIYSVSVIVRRTSDENPGLVAVGLKSGIRLFNDEGKPLLSIPYRHDPALWGDIALATNKTSDRIYLQYQQSSGGEIWAMRALPVFLEELDLQGNVLQSHKIPKSSSHKSKPSFVDQISRYSPPLVAVLLSEAYLKSQPMRPSDLQTRWFNMTPSYTFREMGILSALALFLAILAFLWARTAAFPPRRAVAWAVFVFATGPAGLLAFRVASGWPVRIPCPSCGAKRAIEGSECRVCHEGWLPPKTNGTEIFDTSIVQQS